MKINYDTLANAIYFTVKEGEVAKSLKVGSKLVVDLSTTGDVLGIELLRASIKQKMDLQQNVRNGIPANIV